MGINANGRINLGVEIDEGQIKQSASQIKAILNKEISTVNLDQFFNDKKIQQEVQKSIESINKVLVKSKFKNLDFSTLIPRVDSIMSNTNLAEDMRSQIISGLSYQFQNLDKYASKDITSLLSDSNIMESYTKDLTNIVDFVRSIKGLSTKEQDKMIKSLSKADISDIATAFTLKDLQGTYGSNLKFKMKPKEIIPLLNDKLIDNLDPTKEDQLRNFLGIYNRAKYLAQTDVRKDKDGNIIKGKFATLFEQFQEQYHQEIESFRTQYSDVYNQMERNVMGMSKDFDSIYNTKYKNKALDSSELVRGLKIDRTANQIYDTGADKAPTTTREVVDTVLDVKSDVAELDKKVEEAEKLANEAKEVADEVKEKIQEKNKSTQKKDELKASSKENKKQNEGQTQSTASLDQAKDEVEEKTQDIERSIEELKAEREQLESEKKATEKTKEYLEKENNNINKIIKGQYKDQSKKENYDRLKKQHDNYKEKQEAFNQADETLNSFEIGSDDYYKYISTWQQARKEEQLAWVTYYKAYDVAKNGKNQVAKSRLDKYAPDETIHFDEDELESYINSLQERLDKNKDSIERINQEITDYVKKIDELKENIKEKDTAEKEIEGNVQSLPSPSSTSSNKSNSSNQTKPNIPIDLMGDLENAFGIDFNNTNDSSNIDSVAQAEENLREEADKTNDSLEEQKDIIENVAKTTDTLMYHLGQIGNNKNSLSHQFGSEITTWFEGLKNGGRGWGDGTGLYTTKDTKQYTESILSDKDLSQYYAIDTSKLKLYEAHSEETAKEFHDFIHHLEQYCISMGTNFEGFDDNLENIDDEALYAKAQKLFPDLQSYFNDFDEFQEYINEMITLVSESGINADGTINPTKMYIFKHNNGVDDIKTRFLKQLGYQGTDLSGTSYGGINNGNVIFDLLDKSRIVASGKDINKVIEEATSKINQKTKTSTENIEKNTANIEDAIKGQEKLEDQTKKTTDALENQQQVLSQGKKEEEKTPQSSSKQDDEQNQDKQDKPSKPSAKLKPKKLPNASAVEKPSTNEVKQGEADSANEANNESGSFKLIAGSAEEAAEAKKKFVEANKEVLQSIVGSIPKIEQEAEALEKVNDVPQNNILDNVEQNKPSLTPVQNISEGINDQSLKIEEAYLEAASKVENSRNIYEEAIEGIVEDNNEKRIQEENEKHLKEEQARILKEEQAKIQAQKKAEEEKEKIRQKFEEEKQKREQQRREKEEQVGQLALEQEKKQQEELLKQEEQAKAKVEAQRTIDEKKLKEKLEKQYKITSNKKDYIQNEDVSEKFLEAYNDIPTEKTQELFKTLQQLKQVKTSLQDSFDVEGNLLGDPYQVEQTYEAYNKLIETVRRLKLEISGKYSEETAALKIEQDAKNAEEELNQLKVTIEKTFSKIRGSKDFIQGKDLNDNYLKQFGDKDSTKNLDNLKKTFEQLENIKFQLKLAFKDDDTLIGDPTQTQLLLDRYDYLTEKIKRLKLIIESPNSGENILKEIVEDEEKAITETEKLPSILEKAYSKLTNPEKITTSTEKFLQPYFDLPATEMVDELINTIERIQNIGNEISSSFNEQGELIGNPREIQELIIEYNSLIQQVDVLKQKISSPLSEENIVLQLAKDAEKAQIEIDKLTQKAQKELENLKSTVDKTLGKTDLFEARTQKTIDTYGAYEGNGEGKKAEFITPEAVGEKYGENFRQQQTQVQELIKQLGLYKTAIEELRRLRLSDETTVEQLAQANEKVKALEQNITTLSQSIKTSGIANVTETQIGDLKTKFETLLKNAPNLTKDVREQIQEYIQTLSSGATVSKSAYSSMTADLHRFSAEQTRGSTIWEQMVGKMREGVAFLATKFSFYQIFNQFRQGFEVIHQFDDALTEMMKVSDETRLSLERYQKTTFDIADAIGTNALQIQNSTADFMRLGETLDEAAKSAKAANILMNVSEFQSIDEATKSLIAMGAAYDDLSKMNIIDKLNEIGNNYAISTSEAATALQSSASALKTANNDMDEALALITAGNAVVQDATKVGTGMRTIALRLTGTKSAKEELEEMGEETENVITTQSKLRDVIKEATAVASNEYKGFDILDDNGNYKSTYEIMLGIAEVYDEILETDKKFGRNNANLLLENVAGKNRANIAASIFQNPELLKKAYASSQSADNSAMKENEKYVQSISGHLAQLKNAWQEMWANAANREVINFFIDAAKAVVNFVNAIGLIPASFTLSLPFLEIFSKAKSGKGLVTSFLEWANGLNEIKKLTEETAQAQETLNTVKEAGAAINGAATASIEAETKAKVKGIAGSVGKTVADEAEEASTEQLAIAEVGETIAEEGSAEANLKGAAASAVKTTANAAEAASKTGKEAAKATSKLDLLGGAFKGLASAIGLPTLAFGAFIAICFAAKKAYDAYNEARFNEAKQATDSIKQQQDSMSARIESYKELKAQLDSGDLSEQETIETKQKILDIQKEITNQYGSAAKGVDLVNGKLEQQVGILNSITEKDADRQYGKNYEGFQVASREYRRERNYNVKLNNSNNSQLNEAMKGIYEEVGMKPVSAGMGTFNANVKKNAVDSIKVLEEARDSLEDLKKEYRDPIDVKTIDKQITEIESEIGRAYEIVDKYEETALKGMELELARNQRFGYDAFQNYQTSTSDLESAYASGNTKKIEEARKAFDEANEAKNRFLTIEGNEQFTALFDTIDTSFVETKNQYYDIISLLKDISEPVEEKSLLKKEENKNKIYKKDSKALDKLTKSELKAYKAAEKLYKLNPDRIDIEGTLLDNTYASGKFANALNELMNELGLTTDNADNLIDALVDAGIVQGNAADIANYSTDSYKTFSTSVEEAINALSILNTAMSESASGKGITDQTLEELKKSFGQDIYYALEKTANGYHVNTQQAYLLRQEQEALINGDYSSALMEQYKALDKLHEGYNNALEKGEDVTGFIQQRKTIEENITKLQDEMMAFNNSNSAYQTWLANQSSSGDREMYESIYSGFDTIKDEFKHGWAGIKTRSWMDLILNDEGEADFDVWDASASELKKRYEKLSKDIEGTGGYSIKDFFIDDGNGKITSKGVANFFKAIENKQKEIGKEFVHLNEEGRKVFDFEENGDYQIADLLGIDVEAVQAILRAAVEAGAEVNLDQPIYSIERLGEKAEEAKASLEETLGGELDINLNPESLEEANLDMAKLAQYRDDLKDDISIDPKVKTERLQQLADIMNLLAAKGREITEKGLIDFKFDNSALYKADKKLNTVYQGLEKYTNRFGKRTEGLDKVFSVDPSTLDNLNDLKYFYGTVKEAKLNPEVDSSQIKLLDELLKAIEEKIAVINKQPIEGKNLTFSEYQKGLETVKQINDYIQKANKTDVNFEFNWAEDADFMQLVQWIDGLDEEQKLQLKLDPDLNTQQIIDMAKEGKTITFNVESNKAPNELVPTAPANTQELKQDVQQIIHTKIEASDSASFVFDEVSQKAEEFERAYTGELLVEDNASEDTKEAQKAVDKFGKTVRDARIGVLGSGDSINKANATRDALYEIPANVSSSVNIDVFGAHKIRSALDELSQLRNAAKNNIHLNITKANGTANAFGTVFSRGSIVSGDAFAGGKWGTSKAQTALVGELGTEIMVTPNGQWQTIGDTGAEFVRIPKGSIIFNHKQSKELLQNGHVTSNQGRGHLVGFANGTAYANGVAFSNGDITGLLSSGGSGNSGGGSNGGGNGNHGNNNNKNNNNKSAEKTKETKNTLDEVEILIARIERQISRLDNTIGNTYAKWATRNQAITRDLTKVSEEIKDQKEAYNTYMDKANSIGLPKEWVTIIQNGQQAIEDVVEKAKESGDTSDTLWDKITKYREYYEKALAALDKVQELEQKEGELYKTKFDNEQTYYEEMIDNLQHTVDIMGAYNDQLEESGKLNSRNLIIKQMSVERAKLQKLEDEYTILVKRQDEAVKSGKIKKYSEAWYEMQQAINDVRDAIVEANTNLISFDNAFREVNWNRWDKIHDAVSGVTNELEFLYDLIDEDKMFDDTGTITNEGLAGFALLAQEYDTYFREVQQYQKQIDVTKEELAKDPYNQNLVDKLKEQIEAQQDAINGAKKMKDAMLDVAENGVKKQIDYIKKLIDDYEELMEAQKDQSDYAKKVADQQKEINKLEKQYRAIQNDTSEEGAAKRQQLREQLKEKRQDLSDTQEDRRISETKDMLGKFQETFEDFLENKLKDVEGIIKEGINGINSNGKIITDTINGLANSYGYTPSQTLQNALTHFNTDFASYFNSAFDNDNVRSIVHGVDAIVNHYTKAQKESNKIAMADKVKETGTHIQAYVDEKGKTHVGYFDNNGNHMTKYTGQAKSGDKIYRFENGQKVTKGNRWLTEGGKKYYLDKNGTYATGITSINGKKYYFDSNGQMKTAWQTINGKKYHFNKQGVMHTGLVTIGKNKYYFDKNGVLQMGKWQTINGKRYYLSATDGHVLTGKQKINGEEYIFYNDGALKQKGWKKGTSSVPSSGYAWTNEGFKAEAIIRKSDGAILTPLNRGDSVIPSNAMKNMYQALTNPEKYLKQYTTPDVRVVQANNGKRGSTPATINMQFIANGVQDANKFVNDLMNNKKLEKWIQEVTLGQANGNNSFRKYSYAIR